MTKLTPKAQAEIRETIQVADRELDTSESQIVVTRNHETMEVQPSQPQALAPIPGAGPELVLIQQGLQMGKSGQDMKDLYDLVKQMRADRAREAFAIARAKLQSEIPTIPKTGEASITTRNGASYKYKFAKEDVIANTIRPHLVENGFSYSFDEKESEGKLSCTCTVFHTGGHSHSSTFTCGVESANPNITSAQKTGGTLTTAKRQALIMAFGLSVGDPDLDGAAVDSGETITENQAANLQAALDGITTDKGRQAKFLAMFKVDSFAAIPLTRFGEALAWVEKARKAGGK